MFFIVASARSGTTLMRMMLNAHSTVAVPPESRFITELWPGSDEIDPQRFLDALSRHKMFARWHLPIEAVRTQIEHGGAQSYAEYVEAAYRAYAMQHGKTRWGDKTPRYVANIALLAEMFPKGCFVHMVRDGRNVALSYADVPFGPKTTPRAAAVWGERVRAGLRAGRALPRGRYLEVRYEDLVDDPEGEMKTVCNFLAIEWEPGMLNTERAREYLLARAAKYNPDVTEGPRPDTRNWESDMPPRHVEVFEAVAGDVLSELAYPRRHPQPSVGAKLTALVGRAGLPVARLGRSPKRRT